MKFLIIALTLFLPACGVGTFTVQKTDKTYSQDKSPTFTSSNNRISKKSVAGGYHLDTTGVFLNPFAIQFPISGKADTVGFDIVNKTDFSSAYGGPNQLGILRKLIFRLQNGELITVNISNAENISADVPQYNAVTKIATISKYETGVAVLSVEDFKRVAKSVGLSCKIVGSKQSVVYSVKDISPSFVQNINKFYTTYVH